MTKQKDLKRLIRARMRKTGESYTAARANLLHDDPPPLPDDYERLAGSSDDAVSKATGKDWRQWTSILDRARAAEMEHAEIARLIHERHDGVSGWWAQMVTVAYERFRGLRDVGQRRGGLYDVNKSKTVAVPVEELWRAFSDASVRAEWLGRQRFTIRTATEPKSMRVRLEGDIRLDAYFTSKGEAKSSVTLQLRGLPDRAGADEAKVVWGRRLEALQRLLTNGS